MDEVRRDIKSCVGCGKNHINMVFKPLERSEYFLDTWWTHSAPCPTSGKTVYLRLTVREGNENGKR